MIAAVFPYLRVYNIKRVNVLIHSRISNHLSYLFKELGLKGLEVANVTWRKLVSHNGIRGRKLRRP